MMARQSLHDEPPYEELLGHMDIIVHSQNIEYDVHALEPGYDRCRERRNDPVTEKHSGEYRTRHGISFYSSRAIRKLAYYVCPVVGTKASLDPIDTAAMSWMAKPQSIEATPAIRPMEFESAGERR